MQKSYQDSMAIVWTFGRPRYFITFTANPYWEEINAGLLTDDTGVPMQTFDKFVDRVYESLTNPNFSRVAPF
jgi:helitron helicase-like protein